MNVCELEIVNYSCYIVNVIGTQSLTSRFISTATMLDLARREGEVVKKLKHIYIANTSPPPPPTTTSSTPINLFSCLQQYSTVHITVHSNCVTCRLSKYTSAHTCIIYLSAKMRGDKMIYGDRNRKNTCSFIVYLSPSGLAMVYRDELYIVVYHIIPYSIVYHHSPSYYIMISHSP